MFGGVDQSHILKLGWIASLLSSLVNSALGIQFLESLYLPITNNYAQKSEKNGDLPT